MMNKQEILSQLRDLGWHCESMAEPFDRDNIWRRDCEAIHEAIKYVEKYMRDEEVERQPKTAHWIETFDYTSPTWICSRCENLIGRAKKDAKFCPHCGAEMTEETEEEENED